VSRTSVSAKRVAQRETSICRISERCRTSRRAEPDIVVGGSELIRPEASDGASSTGSGVENRDWRAIQLLGPIGRPDPGEEADLIARWIPLGSRPRTWAIARSIALSGASGPPLTGCRSLQLTFTTNAPR